MLPHKFCRRHQSHWALPYPATILQGVYETTVDILHPFLTLTGAPPITISHWYVTKPNLAWLQRGTSGSRAQQHYMVQTVLSTEQSPRSRSMLQSVILVSSFLFSPSKGWDIERGTGSINQWLRPTKSRSIKVSLHSFSS